MEPDFESILDGDPENWDLRLVYADWLAEHGNERLAVTQRYMAERKICPAKPGVIGKSSDPWHPFYNWMPSSASWPSKYQVPMKIFRKLNKDKPIGDRDFGVYTSRVEAEADLARVLAENPDFV